MTLQLFFSAFNLDAVKQKIVDILNWLEGFIKPITDGVSSFFSNQNIILLVAILLLVGLLTIIGLFRMLGKKPGLFVLILVILAILVGISYFATI